MPQALKCPNSSQFRQIRCLSWVFLTCLTICLPALAAGTEDTPVPRFVQFSIQDSGGNFFPQGEIEFCTEGGRCVYADIQEGFPGNFYLPAEELHPDTLYTVMIYDPQVKVLWEMRDWRFEPRKYDGRWNRWLNVNKFLIFPRFFVHPDRSMSFEIETTLNPEWERLMGTSSAYAGPESLPDYPRFLFAAQGPVIPTGRFGADPEAAGGITSVKPGFGLAGVFRFGHPGRKIPTYRWASFREIAVGYAQNRYETRAVMTPGRGSDVVFHRFWLAAGVGRLSPGMTTHWSVAASLSRGGIYDGTGVLEYLGRTYRMFGVGIQARGVRSIWSSDRADLGLMGQIDLRYHFADEGENDFWYGWEPSISAGLVVF